MITGTYGSLGFYYVTEVIFLQDRLWRKSRSPYENGTCYGVDLNRNFNSSWGSKFEILQIMNTNVKKK